MAFTRGPGMSFQLCFAMSNGSGIGGCLSVGSNAAKSLAAALGKPLVGVHHMASGFVDSCTSSHLWLSSLASSCINPAANYMAKSAKISFPHFTRFRRPYTASVSEIFHLLQNIGYHF